MLNPVIDIVLFLKSSVIAVWINLFMSDTETANSSLLHWLFLVQGHIWKTFVNICLLTQSIDGEGVTFELENDFMA